MAQLNTGGVNAGEMAFYYQEVDADTGADIGVEQYIGGTSDASISFDRATIETTNKDVDYAQYITSFMNWEGSFSGFVSYNDSTAGYSNFNELFEILNCKKLVKLRFRQITGRTLASCGSNQPPADLASVEYPYFEGTAYLTSLEQTANNGEAITMSGGFQGTGTVTYKIPE